MDKMVRVSGLVAILCTAAACAAPQAVCPPNPVQAAAPPAPPRPVEPEVRLETEEQKTLYALGLLLGRNIGVFSLSPTELAIVQAGVRESVSKAPERVPLDDYGPKVDALARSRNEVRAEKELALGQVAADDAAAAPGAVRLPSGAIVRTESPGNGPSPKESDKVKVHYEGKLLDGTVFDSSRKRGKPAEFPLAGVIKCWTEGVAHMKVGERALLTCPADTAYGKGGRPPTIPGGATLIFDVELLEIVP